MRIAIMGTRGVPANYGGFETFARELGLRLVASGHDVTVYSRSNYVARHLKEYQGIGLVVHPVVRHKYLETVVHTAGSVLHSLFAPKYDVVLMCNSANAIFSWIPRLRGQKVVLNVDGLEWKRKKWNALGRLWYRSGAYLATRLPDSIVTDADVIQAFYMEKYRAESTMIPYGASIGRDVSPREAERLGLRSGRYFLYVSRLEPENNAHLVAEAFLRTTGSVQLALIGSAPYAEDYVKRVRSLAGTDSRVVMPGGVYGDGYASLQQNALAYIHATEVGGTHPALVEAMAAGNCILAYRTPENEEVLGDAGIYWADVDELLAQMEQINRDPEGARLLGKRAMARADAIYSWDEVTARYLQLFEQLLA